MQRSMLTILCFIGYVRLCGWVYCRWGIDIASRLSCVRETVYPAADS
jgi:hypothetical protein